MAEIFFNENMHYFYVTFTYMGWACLFVVDVKKLYFSQM